jgi:hypothetical protein
MDVVNGSSASTLADACCPDQTQSYLLELAADPTLSQCCRRDLEEQAQMSAMKAALMPHDRSTARQRLAAQVVRQVHPLPPPCAEQDDEEQSGSDEEYWGKCLSVRNECL